MFHLKELRQKKHLTQLELSRVLQISASSIGMYEQGRREPDHETLTKIADFFNVSVDYLLGRTDNPLPKLDLPPGETIGSLASKWVPLEPGDVVLQESPSYRVLAHTTKDLPEEALQELIQIAEIIKKRYNVK